MDSLRSAARIAWVSSFIAAVVVSLADFALSGLQSAEPISGFAAVRALEAMVGFYGIAGLGLAGSFMIRAAAVHPRFRLCAAMDPLPRPRQAFAQQFRARVYGEFADLCADPEVEAIYISSPHRFHASQTIAALEHGKHVLVEKPLALTMDDCDAIVAAADRTGRTAIVGHTHAFDPSIREMRRIIEGGELGRLGMILAFNYNDFLLRPHRADEFDEPGGGGIAFNQVSHQIEIVRSLGGDVRSVRAHMGALDPARLESYRKLLGETAFERRRADPLARQEQDRMWKSRTKDLRRLYRDRGH